MLSRMFSRAHRAVQSKRKSVAVEGLEDRTLMSLALPIITGVLADNRGEITIQFNHSVGGLSLNTVHFYTAGPDGKIGTKDDVGQAAPVSYSPSRARLIIDGVVKANKGYRIRIDSASVKDKDGQELDGEFTGNFPTGNGVQGGNFQFYVKNDASLTPTVRMWTNQGFIDLKMREDVAPNTVANFLDYANTGRYDNTFFTRSANNPSPFVIQGGSLQITGKGTTVASIKATKQDAALADENPGGISNTLGTLAFAKGGPNSATNQFFINLADNSFLDSKTDPNTSGGFTVFAQIIKNLTIAQAINQKPIVTLFNTTNGDGVGPQDPANTGLDNVPVTSTAHLTTKVEVINSQTMEQEPVVLAGLNPTRDLIVIQRVAVIDKVKPIV